MTYQVFNLNADFGWCSDSYSDKGSRPENEDSCQVAVRDDMLCLVLADGVGGNGNGRLAADTVTDTILEHFRYCTFNKPTSNIILEAIEEANKNVVALQTEDCHLQATCVTLWIEKTADGYKAVWAHVGDSRLYFYKNKILISVTKDHSLKELWKDKADILDLDISKNVIWQAIGENNGVKPDIGEAFIKKDEKAEFFICSDGIWENISPKRLNFYMKLSKTPYSFIARVKDYVASNKKASGDNNTGIALFFGRFKNEYSFDEER